ncbi:MAG: response regulator [Lachnospiraceae bacterium]|nr:response regulator [Lachnospiraceae bacterium]
MYTKIIYVVIDIISILSINFTIHALRKVKQEYGRLLRFALSFAVIAILANIMIALSVNATMADLAYSLYFASIDWILLYLTGFCLAYTDHEKAVGILKLPTIIIVSVDSLIMLSNHATGFVFDIYEKNISNTVFFQTNSRPVYYIHLAIDYIAVVITFLMILYRVVKSYDMYRLKYIMIFLVLVFVIGLNLVCMAFSLVLDASIVFYAVAGTLIYILITRYVPRKLMNGSIGMAVNDMKEGLILFDANAECIFANTFSKNHFSLTEETATFEAEPMATVLKSLEEDGKEFGKATYIQTSVNEDGKTKEEHYQIRYNALKDRKDRQIGSYMLIEDVTEEVSYLKQLRDARNKADDANRAKSLFLANMSHEIRTPLNAVLGMNEMILREAKVPELVNYAENIHTSGTVLLNLINDILDFSRIEAHKMDVTPVEYEPHALLRDMCNRFDNMAEEKGLYLDINCDRDIPLKLIGDEKHLTQILSNIISNAIKYTRKGGITVNVDATVPVNDEVTIIFNVTDTGIGIETNDIQYLFDAFERVNEKENATIQGTGLGLAITKELVELMGGSIRVESELGNGSSFIVSITQKIADPSPAGPFNKDVENSPQIYRESFRAPQARMLIVDDVEVNIIVIRELLRETQIRIDSANSGDEAIAMCRENKYDLILLDHRMPKKDGIETYRELCGDTVFGMNTTTPVIMLTANALSGADAEYKNLGFADYLTKPIDSKELEMALVRLLPKEKVTVT